MKARMLVGLLLTAVLLVATVSTGQAQKIPLPQTSTPSEPSALAAPPGWIVETIDSPNDVGRYASIAFNLFAPVISYYDATNKDLRVAAPASSGANCGPSNTWTCQVVDNTADVGQYSSIAFPVSAGLLTIGPGIAYFDATNGALKFAEFRAGLVGKWVISTIAPGGGGFLNGRFAAVKYDSNGTVRIAYQSQDPFQVTSLSYAHSVSGGGNCGVGAAAGLWQCDRIDSSGGTGMYISLDVSSTNEPFISYYDSSNADLKVANPVSSGGNCGPGNTWTCQVVDNAGDVGQYSSIAFPSGLSFFGPGIAYFDATNSALKFAERSCIGFPCTWHIFTIASGAGTVTGRYASLKYDSTGVVHIGYQVTAASSAALWYAHSVPGGGDCGLGSAAGLWQCAAIDSGSGIGAYASLALSGTRPYIAYYDGGNGDLKLSLVGLQLYLPIILR